ncbi:MAG: DNA-processing protein DprA [Patescibacteria group bacterium]|nr:DNA-processing protein DprA [Patescibacteria group bacterium]
MTSSSEGQISPEDRMLILSLSRVCGLGPISFRNLLKRFYSVQNIFETDVRELEKVVSQNIAREIKSAKLLQETGIFVKDITKLGIEYFTISDENYPKFLKEIHDPPIVLYYRGDFQKISFLRAISVVGTRRCSEYGKLVTKRFVSALAESGFTIVSGLAFGIDKAAHEAALAANGGTVAVLPGGVDKAVPLSNYQIFKKILKNGLIVSEEAMGSKLSSGMFPSRNRIISGLSIGTLVIEAGARSGALITAYQALEQGREVFAVPGDVLREKSKGTNSLIKRGEAKLVQTVDDILVEFGIKNENKMKKKASYSSSEKRVIDAIISGYTDVDSVSQYLGTEVSSLLSTISLMEIEGKLAKNEKNQYFVLK